jgi:hypothetical protein
MSEHASTTSAGTTQESGTTGLADGPGESQRDEPVVSGGIAGPTDRSATADSDHPGMPAGGDPGDETAAGGLAGNPEIRAEVDES